MDALWQTPETRETLLKRLIQHHTVTDSESERTFPSFVKSLLLELDYFNAHQDQLQITYAKDEKPLLLAHYRAAKGSKRTVVLISYFDTVGIEDYGMFETHAMSPDALYQAYLEHPSYLDSQAQIDLESGDYLFGRGSMDMKAGLMLHMSLLEKAIIEAWDVNLILVTVPDEEVYSSGMRKAVEALANIKEKEGLDIQLHLNSEPTMQEDMSSDDHYVYSGSIGKMMPGIVCYGKATHVGNPLSGLSSNYMMSYINQAIEYNRAFRETYDQESTPLPVSLMNKDLKVHYDVQTPFISVGLYNVFSFKRSPEAIFRLFNDEVIAAVERCEQDWLTLLENEDLPFEGKINVLTLEQLKGYAIQQFGESQVETWIDEAIEEIPELYYQNLHIAKQLLQRCSDITPAVVTLFAAPYYPAVNASEDPLAQRIVKTVQQKLESQYQRPSHHVHYFNTISDSSYAQHQGDQTLGETFKRNCANFNRTYHLPFESIQRISAPTILCGPVGKDAHKMGERLHKHSAFVELPYVLETIITEHFIKG
ncbi:M20/M25/M40 family metallo-hydrolase [Staphylococcus auricularis]|uniref:M20/M25/M40 family metallo-hydrolase n=1 Tax=Staphylococcus auricularis TaxID=29379 RepID=UPI002431C56F|nr:M20/M25/M40 family metallo-hydrolase [Staphylococcus auricularis]